MHPVPASTGVAKRAHDPIDAKRKRTRAAESKSRDAPSRVVRVPLQEAVCAAVQLASATAQFVPNTHLFSFVPLHSICDPPDVAAAENDAALASDNVAALASDDDDASVTDDETSNNNSDSDDQSDSDVSDGSDDDDSDGSDDDSDGKSDTDDKVNGKIVAGDDKSVSDDDDDESSSASVDDDYADEWNSDSSDDDEDDDDDDELHATAKANGSAKQSGVHEDNCDAADEDDDDDIDAPIELFDGVWVLASHVPTLYTSSEAALGAALAQRRSRRTPLQGIVVEFRPLREPPVVRITEQMLAVANLNNECGGGGDDDDDDDDALFVTPLTNGVAPSTGAGDAAAAAASGATDGNGTPDDNEDDDDDDEEDDIQDAEKYEDIDYAQLISEDDLRAPDTMDKIVVGPPPVEPFPCQRRMAFHVRRYAQGRPAVPECDFAAMYHMSQAGHMGWVDVDVRGTSCIRAHWKAVTKHMVYCGDAVIGAAEVTEFVNMQMTDVLGEPIVSDSEKFSVLYALRSRTQ